MKERILTGWNLQRIILLLIGMGFIIYAIIAGTWTGIFLGTYFAAMGVFRMGCAAGSCYGGACGDNEPSSRNMTSMEVQYEEVNTR